MFSSPSLKASTLYYMDDQIGGSLLIVSVVCCDLQSFSVSTPCNIRHPFPSQDTHIVRLCVWNQFIFVIDHDDYVHSKIQRNLLQISIEWRSIKKPFPFSTFWFHYLLTLPLLNTSPFYLQISRYSLLSVFLSPFLLILVTNFLMRYLSSFSSKVI